MIYQINKALHNDFSIFEKNKLAPRAYQIPYYDIDLLKKQPIAEERYQSDAVQVLSGVWDFKYYKSVKQLPNQLNTLKTQFDTIPVPGDWQRNGFQEPVYLNCPYEIDNIPPELPDDMSAGIYRKFFEYKKENKVAILSFLGVANNIAVYLNGSFVGYSEGSHNTAEFDITEYLTDGTNELVAVMFRWCNGTFLEAQDMFRENGIFRDVLLYNYNPTYLYDYEIVTEKTKNGYKTAVNAQITGDCEGACVCAELTTADGKTVKTVKADAKNTLCLDFGVLDVTEWNAEIPTVYYLYITVSDKNGTETVRNITGFKTITIENSVFLFNEKPIKCKGVNHHDTDLYKGYAMSFEDIERDIKLMKQLNVNAVRTSHYPPDPYFIQLAALNGLYVIDEADIETHGCARNTGDINFISNDLKWASHYVDRVSRMYHRDRNNPAILMWSLGNEAGGYKCHDKCYKYLKSVNSPIPVHYEGVVEGKRFHYDVISRMYASTEQMEQMMNGTYIWQDSKKLGKEYNKFPFFLCEYCHAMGVGPGNLEEYWDIIYEWDTSMGGCIWEWADHCVYHDDNDKKYKYRYTYGGDHGEKLHDGHFCVDGLVYADRRLHTGAKEMRVVYRPIRASVAGNKLYCFENTNRFRNSSYIGVKWELLQNGEKVQIGDISLNLAPMASECFVINHKDIDLQKDWHINFIYTNLDTGEEIATEQLTLNDVDYEYDIEIGSKIGAQTENGVLTVNFENGYVCFDGSTGDMTSYVINGKELLASKCAEASGFMPNLFRALIDNDARLRDDWREGGLDKLQKSLKSFDAHIDDGEIDVEAVFALKFKRKEMYETKISYVISSLGAIEVTAELQKIAKEAVTDIPRFGLTLELNRSFETAEYYGRGTAENMPDFKCQAPVGIYKENIDDMFEPYVYPQESGMHGGVKWIKLIGKNDTALRIYANSSLYFSVHHFTQNAVERAQHQEDLKDMNITFITLDGFVRGIGSSSCGPDTREEYRGNVDEGYTLSFTVIPE